MSEEIVRELVGGEWVTHAKAVPSGGVPDPSGEPDGDVLTVASGAAVWAPGGGSQPSSVSVAAIEFTETDGLGNYSGDLVLPAGSAVLDWVLINTADWDADVVQFSLGDSQEGATAYLDTAAIEAGSLSVYDPQTSPGSDLFNFANSGGNVYQKDAAWIRSSAGINGAGGGVRYPAGTIIAALISTLNATPTGGTTGRTTLYIFYVTPDVTAAVKS